MADLDRVLRQQKVFLREKSIVRWLVEGIRISTSFTLYLHAEGKMSLSSMQIDDDIIYDPDGINEHVISYYQLLFLDSSYCSLEAFIVREISNFVTSDASASILCVPSYDEMRETILYIDPLSALGLDGFTGRFYRHYWDIIGQNVVLAV